MNDDLEQLRRAYSRAVEDAAEEKDRRLRLEERHARLRKAAEETITAAFSSKPGVLGTAIDALHAVLAEEGE